MNPQISVIVPCYNQAQYLDECLQSVLDQTYQNWECIIVNDGSPDNTEETAKKWVEKDNRFKYFYKENGGLSSARNFGINLAKGEWILPLDSDDYISVNYLDLAKNHFNSEEVMVIYCNAEKFGADRGKLELKSFTLQNLSQGNVIFCTAFFRRIDWEKVGGYDENLLLGYEDWEFWINILKDGGNVLKLDAICFFYRIKNRSMLKNLQGVGENYTIEYIEKKHLSFFHKYLGTLHYLHLERLKSEKVLEFMEKRFFTRLINKLYTLKENYLNI